MKKWVIIIAAIVLVAGAAVGALVFTGAWPGPSAADRQQARVLVAQAETQLESGDQDAALRTLTQALDLAPENEALRARASIYVARGEFDPALRDVNKLVSRGGARAGDYSLRCWLRARGDGLDGARDDCDRALELDPQLASAFGNRGLVGLRQRRHYEAWEDFNTALRVGGSDEWVAWRLFGRGVAAVGKGDAGVGREDIETALHGNPAVAAEYAQFGVGIEIVTEFEEAAYAAVTRDRTLMDLRRYQYVYPSGAHTAEVQAQIDEIYAWIAQDQAAGQQTLPGFSLAQVRGEGSPDSFGAIAISRSTWRIAFATDYASDAEAERAAATACNGASVRDCEAFAFRNVCAALAISPAQRTRGMAWAYGQDDAVRTAVRACRDRGGRACVPVHSQCTPTEPLDGSTPAASPE